MAGDERKAWVQQFSNRYIIPVVKRFPELQEWNPVDIIKLVAFISNLATLRVTEDYEKWGDDYLDRLSEAIKGWEDSETAREFIKEIAREMDSEEGGVMEGEAE